MQRSLLDLAERNDAALAHGVHRARQDRSVTAADEDGLATVKLAASEAVTNREGKRSNAASTGFRKRCNVSGPPSSAAARKSSMETASSSWNGPT